MKPVTLTIDGETREYPSAWLAFVALARRLPKRHRSPMRVLEMMRQVSQETKAIPGQQGAAGSNVVRGVG